jgi:hypothetical protein
MRFVCKKNIIGFISQMKKFSAGFFFNLSLFKGKQRISFEVLLSEFKGNSGILW